MSFQATCKLAPLATLWVLGLGASLIHCTARSGVDNDPANILASPTHLLFAGTPNAVITPQSVAITDSSGARIPIAIQASNTWVEVNATGQTTPLTLQVGIDNSGLAPGDYSATIVVTILTENTAHEIVEIVVDYSHRAEGFVSLDGPHLGIISVLTDSGGGLIEILAGTQTGAIYGSSDGGKSFEHFQTLQWGERIRSIDMHPSGRGYASADSNSGLFRSDDGGRTWQLSALQNITVYQVVSDAADELRVLARTSTGIWFSSDGGDTWASNSAISSCTMVARRPGASTGFLLADAAGGLHSSDGVSETPLSTLSERDFVTVGTRADGKWLAQAHDWDSRPRAQLLLSENNGASWEPIGTGLPPTGSGAFALSTSGSRVWMAHAIEGTYYSDDGGLSFWPLLFEEAPWTRDSGFTSVLPHADGTLLGHSIRGIFRMDANGGLATVQLFSSNLNQFEQHPLTGDIYASSRGRAIFKFSTDGEFTGLGGAGYATSDATGLAYMLLDPRDPARITATSWNFGPFHSDDFGQTWAPRGGGFPDRLLGMDRAPENPDVIWAVSSSGNTLLRSVDDGLNYSEIILPNFNRYWVSAASADKVLITSYGAYHYDLATDTHTELSQSGGNNVHLNQATSDGSLWFWSDHTGLMRSTDGSANFSALGLKSNPGYSVALSMGATGTIYVATRDGLMYTEDNGTTWQDLGCPFPPLRLALDDTTGVLYIATAGGGVYRYSTL